MTELERVRAELEAEQCRTYECPNGCGTLVPVGIEAAVQAHMEARQKAEQRFERLAAAIDRFLTEFEASELRGALPKVDLLWQ